MKKNTKLSFRHIWLAVGVFSLISLCFLHASDAGGDSHAAVRSAILVVNTIMFILALPCSFFAVPVLVAAAFYLEMSPTSNAGITLSTILLFLIGTMQWFWIARFWSPVEPPLQMLNLPGGSSE